MANPKSEDSPAVAGVGGNNTSRSPNVGVYTAQHLLLDLTPIGLYVVAYGALWRIGLYWLVLFLIPLQCYGAFRVFRSLVNEVARPNEKRATIILPPSNSEKQKRPQLTGFKMVQTQTVNPFLHPSWLLQSQWERLRLAAMSVTLVPIRFFSTVAVLSTLWCALHVVLIGFPLSDLPTRPLAAWRSRLVGICLIIASKALMFFGFGFYNIKEIHPEKKVTNVKDAPIVVANHLSFVDPILMFARYHSAAVGAIENLRIPIVGFLCGAVQTITVSRLERDSRRQVAATILHRAHWSTKTVAERMRDFGVTAEEAEKVWPQSVIFAEGTCENGEALINFKPGAFVAQKPVQPVLIRYHREAYPLHRFHPCWVPAGSMIGNMALRLWSEPMNYASVEYMDPISATPEEIEVTRLARLNGLKSPGDRNSPVVMNFANRVRAAMAEKLNIPTTQHCFLDVVIQEVALAQGEERIRKSQFIQDVASSSASALPSVLPPLPGTPAMPLDVAPIMTSSMEVLSIQAAFDVSIEQIRKHIEQFRAMDESQRGHVTYSEFLRYFDIDEESDRNEGLDSSMRRLFHLLDDDNSGTLDVREFLLGFALVGEVEDEDVSVMKLAFHMFDLENHGKIDIRLLKRAFRRTFSEADKDMMDSTFNDLTSSSSSSSSSTDKNLIDFPTFEKWCRSQPKCIAKFREVMFKNYHNKTKEGE